MSVKKTIKRWIERGVSKYQAGSRSEVLIRKTEIEAYLTKQQGNTLNSSALVDEVVEERVRLVRLNSLPDLTGILTGHDIGLMIGVHRKASNLSRRVSR